MLPSQRITPLLQRAQEREDGIIQTLDEYQQHLQTQRARLEELQRYTTEYANTRLTTTNPAAFMNRQAFLDRLHQAVQQQTQLVKA